MAVYKGVPANPMYKPGECFTYKYNTEYIGEVREVGVFRYFYNTYHNGKKVNKTIAKIEYIDKNTELVFYVDPFDMEQAIDYVLDNLPKASYSRSCKVIYDIERDNHYMFFLNPKLSSIVGINFDHAVFQNDQMLTISDEVQNQVKSKLYINKGKAFYI